MADAQRGQFVIDCKSGEAAGIIYGLVHDKTLFRPELDLANAHPKEFDNEHIFPLDMFINSDYMLKLSREEFAKELKRLFDEDKIGYTQVVVATDIHDMHRIVVLTDPTQKDKLSRIAVSLVRRTEKGSKTNYRQVSGSVKSEEGKRMLANIAVLRTVKANVNEAIMVALPSILFESSHDKKDTQKYYLQGPAAEYIPVEIPDTYAKKFSKCATALAMQLVLLSNKTKGFFGPEICNVEGKDIQTARSIINSIMGERQARFYSAKLNDEVYDTQYAVSEYAVENWVDDIVPPVVINSCIWAIVANTAAEMQKDNRFLRRKEICDTEFFEIATRHLQ